MASMLGGLLCKPYNPLWVQSRNITLKDISVRLKSIKNIQKITKTMKLIATTKYARAERELRPARPYGVAAKSFYEKAEISVPVEDTTTAPDTRRKHLLVAVASDRGLCGAANSSVVRAVRDWLNAGANSDARKADARIVAIGDRARTMLRRLYAPQLLLQVNEVSKMPPTFVDAAAVVEAIVATGYEFDVASVYYNRFKSVVSYETTMQPLYSTMSVNTADQLSLYDSVDEEVLRSYNEFALVSLMYYVLKEASASEQSARMTAMGNATKNAGELIDKLTMTYNRTRQAVITRELIEIISGAAAV